MTGLSGTGKTTICESILRKLKPTMPQLGLVDGDVVRDVFGNDLDYSEPSRHKQIKRIQSLAKVMDDQDFVVLVALIQRRGGRNVGCCIALDVVFRLRLLQRRYSRTRRSRCGCGFGPSGI